MSIDHNTGALGGWSLASRGNRLIAMLSVLAVLVGASVVWTNVESASAAKYPSWSEVVAARKSEAATKQQVAVIQALLHQLQADADATAAASEKAGDAYQEADENYFEASIKKDELQAQADAAAASAKASEIRAGQLAAQLARTGNDDLTLNILMNGDKAGDLLSMMGQAGKVTEQANGIYEKALQDKNTAQALTDQANVAAGILAGLKAEAEKAFAAAQAAADAADAAVAANEAHKAELTTQLAALTTARQTTEADYKAGEIEKARLKKIADAKAAAAAAAAAKEALKNGLGPAGAVVASGWAKPVSGYISSGFGYRLHPILHYYRLHSGTDLATSCGTPIHAAKGGTVIYAGWYGTYGNWVLIDNGSGIQTGYAHIVNGGIKVHVGQKVSAGQTIALVGMTGYATGCHLHFEVRHNGVAENAVPFMRSKGITLG
ncbi:M23 family metallopeptidase [Glaciihabitans sp. dw_435]|uniref:M23 family metallopeptidase n=1 Tax=Glaciihabitans sp. dw_435 TaxID=2720081 RepID=UPI001BD648D2|nr:M23 family metallopeptidase [Glaciihabitans sp. dw_435]